MAKATLYMETTGISPEKSAGEICAALVSAGALQINQQFENRKLIGLRWTMRINGQEVPFAMPARVDPVEKLLLSKRKGMIWEADRQRIREQAERVAWRQLLRWVQAQLAMIETGMVEAGEVFLPYVSVRHDRTLYQQIAETRFKGLLGPVEAA